MKTLKQLLSEQNDIQKEINEFYIKKIIENTNKYWDGLAPQSASKKAKAITKIVDELEVCDETKDAILHLFSIVLDEHISFSNRIEFCPGVVVFIKRNSNNHNYGIGPVFLINIHGTNYISKTTSYGNSLPEELTLYRKPTEREIRNLMAVRYNKIINYFTGEEEDED